MALSYMWSQKRQPVFLPLLRLYLDLTSTLGKSPEEQETMSPPRMYMSPPRPHPVEARRLFSIRLTQRCGVFPRSPLRADFLPAPAAPLIPGRGTFPDLSDTSGSSSAKWRSWG